MKVCVVTLYNGSNYGAHLQAFALKTVLERRGHQVVHLETGARNPKSTAVKKVIKRLITLDWRKASIVFQWKRGNVFVQEAKKFDTCNFDQLKDIDLVIFGSDEIWNVRRKQIYKYPMLFGKNVENNNKASYAVSINDATREDFKKHIFSIEEISKFKKITVRDEYSRQVLADLLPDKDIQVVVDPTLLLEQKDYECITEEPQIKDFILVYSYGIHLDEDKIEQMKTYAKKHGLKLVSVLGYLSWCDYNLPCSTSVVLGLFKEAALVFTDTFHGTIFSMIFEKSFIIISKGTKKLDNLLNMYSLESRKMQEMNRTLEDITEEEIDYVECNRKKEELRKYSLDALNSILDLKKRV